MVECDTCGNEVPEVWRRREFSSGMTHRTVTWLCRGCHPSVPETVATANEPTPGVALTDGGTAATGCPSCGGPTVDGQGLVACRECAWSGTM